MLTRREANGLDAYLTREPRETESDLYCPICDVPSSECVQPEDDPYTCELCGERDCENGEATMGHAAQWITYREKARGELADYLYDRD